MVMSVCPSVSHFPHFCLTYFDIIMHYTPYDFVLQYYRSSWSVVNICQFLGRLHCTGSAEELMLIPGVCVLMQNVRPNV